ncbi:hypothetical protein ACEWY4_020287 [Coilia grayii]|uniref:UBX domain-containing protein 11 n=1 Tax=Coilia grayii TaxID=363190 RepID=A0ABD1JC84_9TELE
MLSAGTGVVVVMVRVMLLLVHSVACLLSVGHHFFPTENELSLLGDVFARRCRPGPSSPDGTSSKPKMSPNGSTSDSAPPTDFELMSTMIRKLSLLEVKVKAQALDIQRKEKTIAVLEKKLELQKKCTGQTCEEELTKMCHRLQKQVWEMEQFLSDYGMIWVGDSAEGDSDQPRTHEDEADKHSSQSLWDPASSRVGEFRMNFDLVLENVRELNVLAGDGESYVKAVPGGAQLARHTPIPLQLYSNGIVMFSGPFRSYDDPSTQRCMQDLMDGYFPSELQERYPDGVPFQLQDKREEEYRVQRAREDFPGKGKALSTEQFLRKLPKAVIKAGKVIDIRGSIREHLQESAGEAHSHSVTLIDTPALQALKERLDQPDRDPNKATGDISTLRVKSEDGEKTFILKMQVKQTIGDLRQYLDKHRCTDSAAYNIISVFPRRCYDDDAQTLADCGLTPSAALLLQPR